LAAWIRRRARARRIRLDGDAADTLATVVGLDLRRLDTELLKLGLYCGARPATVADVHLLVAPGDSKVFDLLDAVAEKRPGAALAAVRRLLHEGVAPEAIVPQLTALVRRLLVARELLAEDDSLAERGPGFGLSPNPRAQARLGSQAAGWTPDGIDDAYRLLLDCDRAVKTGARNPEVALELLVAELTH
jgi:DNA polymerase-3 subunit delta